MGALLAKALSVAVLIHAPCLSTSPAWDGDHPPACVMDHNTVYLGPEAKPGMREHELGHVIDFMFLTDADRGRFKVYASMPKREPFNNPAFGERAIAPTVWWSDPNGPYTHYTLGEQFAEAVRSCAHSTRFPAKTSLDSWMPTTSAHRRVCRWLATL